MKTLDLFRKLKNDIDLVFSGDYHGDDDSTVDARRAAVVRGMLVGHIDAMSEIYLDTTPEPARTVAQFIINDAGVHYGLLSRWAAMEKVGAVKPGAFKGAEKHIQVVAAAEKTFAAIDSGGDYWPAARVYAHLHHGDASWFDKQKFLRVMRPAEARVPLR
ncbi:hypothetical protein WMF38_57535 [Sorangium sp. So ce118]